METILGGLAVCLFLGFVISQALRGAPRLDQELLRAGRDDDDDAGSRSVPSRPPKT